MKLTLFIILLLCIFTRLHADYKLLTDYQNTLYQLILDYVQANETSSSPAVLEFIYSADTKTVFSDALVAGYSRREVILGTYQGSFMNHPNKVIIQALHDAVLRENMAHDASFYGSFVTMVVSVITVLVLARYFYTYFKYDRKALNYYRANHGNYLMKGDDPRNTITSTGIATNTNRSSIETTPFVEVPEPFF